MDALFVGAGTVAAAWAIPVSFLCLPVGYAMAAFGTAAVLVGCGVDIAYGNAFDCNSTGS